MGDGDGPGVAGQIEEDVGYFASDGEGPSVGARYGQGVRVQVRDAFWLLWGRWGRPGLGRNI